MMTSRTTPLLLVLWASVALAQTTTTTTGTTTTTMGRFTPTLTAPIGGRFVRLASNVTCAPCESTLGVTIDSWEDPRLAVDCDGACDVRLVCRMPAIGFGQRDPILLSMQPADGLVSEVVPNDCDNAIFQVRSCTPTASAVCRVRAWLW